MLVISVVLILNHAYETAMVQFVIESDLFSKTFTYQSAQPGPIGLEVMDKQVGKSEASSRTNPYFEFVVNHKLVSSDDALWKFTSSSDRALANGGAEYTLIFEGVALPVVGLQVRLLQQQFPGSTLMGEKVKAFSLHSPPLQAGYIKVGADNVGVDSDLTFKFSLV